MTATPDSESSAAPADAAGPDDWPRFLNAHGALIDAVVGWPKWGFSWHTRRDIAQQVRAELPRSVRNCRRQEGLPNLIKRICINRCIDQVRREARERGWLVPLSVTGADGVTREREIPAGEAWDPVRIIVRHEQAAALRQLLGQLDPTCVTAIRLFYIAMQSYKEISSQLGIAVNTVGSRLAKCLEKLRRLAEHDKVLGE